MTTSPLLSVEHVTKRYAGIPVLQDVSFSAEGGEIVAVIGENGAGKSTLMKILAGVIPSGGYDGAVRLDDSEIHFAGPHDAERAGIVMIPQELAVVPYMSIAENLMRNREPARFGLIDTARMVAEARSILRDFDIDLDVDRPMRGLGLAFQQLVEIAKALSKSARILVLDEPTASLTKAEADQLFERLRRLRSQGYLCIYISHRIDEVVSIADRVLVLRDGSLAGERKAEHVPQDELVRLMLGRSVGDVFPDRRNPPGDRTLLTVDHLTVADPVVASRKLVDDASFEIRAGEILGVFGLVGAGRTELVSTIFGVPPGPASGSIRVDGELVDIKGPSDAIAAGIALVTEDRRRYGFIPELGIRQNVSLADLQSITRWGQLDAYREEVLATKIAQELRLHAASLDQPVRTLSGGNQQKVVVGKWLATDPLVLVLDDPTRGIDVGAKVDMYRILADLADRGVAILFISSEADEILGIADRVLVMSNGRVVADRRNDASQEELLGLATRATGADILDGTAAEMARA